MISRGKNALDIIGHAEEHLIERIAENMHTFGMPATLGRVLGIIYMNRKPMTLNELSEATGMSKTRMSQVVREMTDANLAEKVFEKAFAKTFTTWSVIITRRLSPCLRQIGQGRSAKQNAL